MKIQQKHLLRNRLRKMKPAEIVALYLSLTGKQPPDYKINSIIDYLLVEYADDVEFAILPPKDVEYR